MSRKGAKVDLSDDSTTITSEPAILHSILINVAISAHVVDIKNGEIPMAEIVASAAAMTRYPFDDMEFPDGIVIDPDDSASGSITVIYENWDSHRAT